MQHSSAIISLNFPAYSFKIQEEEGKHYIFDIVRKKFVRLEPEEWVRQHLVRYLVEMQYPIGLISIEKGHRFNKLRKRTDVVVFNKEGRPLVLAECKAPQVKPSKKLLEQAVNYNRTVQAPFLVLSNGLQHFFIRTDFSENRSTLIGELPFYEDACAIATNSRPPYK